MKQNNLTTDSIPKLIRTIALPASIGFFFNTMYNVVDTFFAGKISPDALAALSLSFPVFFIIIALGSGISTGASALIANALGAGDKNKALRYASSAVSFGIITSFVIALLGFFASPALLKLLGSQGEFTDLANQYLQVIFLGTPFFMLTFTLNSMLNAKGNTIVYRNLLIAGFFLNIILDPWFLYGGLGLPAMGISGIALATVVIQIIGSGYLAYKVCHEKMLCIRPLRNFLPEKQSYLDIAKQGVPSSLNMMTVALGIFVITYFVSLYGEKAIAAYGITTRLDQIALLPNIGLNIAVITLIGQNYGAKNYKRVREVYFTALKYGLIIATFSVAGAFFFSRYLILIFSKDPEIIRIGTEYLKILVFVYWAFVILFISNSALQGLKKPMFTLWIGLIRQLILPLIFLPIFTKFFDFGIRGVWWVIFAIVWFSAGIMIFYIRKKLAFKIESQAR